MSILNPVRDFNIEEDGIQFMFRVPTPGQKIEIDSRVARRIGFAKLDSIPDASYWYAVALEYLTMCITPISAEYKGIIWSEIDDYDLVSNLYKKCIDKENEFLEELKKKKNDRRTANNRVDVRPLPNEKPQYTAPEQGSSGRPNNISEGNSNGSRSDSGGLLRGEDILSEEIESPANKRNASRRVSIN